MATKQMPPATETEERSKPSLGGRFTSPGGISRSQVLRKGSAAVLFLFALLALPAIVSDYYVIALTLASIYAIVSLGLAVLVGRVGMVSMGQVAILILGAWAAARLLFATSLPFPIVLLMAGLSTMVLGVLVSLPTLRMRGLYLALITLMLAGAITSVLENTGFPNGAHGFLGYNSASVNAPALRRPSIATGDPAFLRYTIVITLLMFLLVGWHLRSKPGRAWASIRQSEASALASGINVVRYKLWAFALASFVTGVAGGLFAGAERYLFSSMFTPADSIQLLAVVLMGGVFNVYGAVLAGLLDQFLPQLLNAWGVSIYWATILFGVGALQVLTTAPAGIIDQAPKDLANLGRLIFRLCKRAVPAGGRAE